MSMLDDAQRIRTPQETQWPYCPVIGGSGSEESGALSFVFRIVEKQDIGRKEWRTTSQNEDAFG